MFHLLLVSLNSTHQLSTAIDTVNRTSNGSFHSLIDQDTEDVEEETVAPDCTASSSGQGLILDEVSYELFISGVEVPSRDWLCHYNQEEHHVLYTNHHLSPDRKLFVKSMTIRCPNAVEMYLNGMKIAPPDINQQFSNKDELSAILAAFHIRKPCAGIEQHLFRNVTLTKRFSGYLENGVWRSRQCMIMGQKSDLCVKCTSLKNYLMKRKSKENESLNKAITKQKHKQQKWKTQKKAIRRIQKHGEVIG